MKTFEWNARTIVIVAIALLLTASVGTIGVSLLLSGQPGTGMMESGDHAAMMATAAMGEGMADHTMGAPANRGIFGGYTGAIGLVMILVFMVMVATLLYTLLREKPGQPRPAACWSCERPVETDWTSCPYCGVALAEGGRQPKAAEAQSG